MYPCPEFSLDHHCVDETQNFSRSCIQSNNQFHHLCIGVCRTHQCSARATQDIQDNMGMTMGHADGVADSLLLGLEPEAWPEPMASCHDHHDCVTCPHCAYACCQQRWKPGVLLTASASVTSKGTLKQSSRHLPHECQEQIQIIEKILSLKFPSKEALASFCPSKTIHTTKRHKTKCGKALVPDSHNVRTVTKFEGIRQASSTQKDLSFTSFFLLHHNGSPGSHNQLPGLIYFPGTACRAMPCGS